MYYGVYARFSFYLHWLSSLYFTHFWIAQIEVVLARTLFVIQIMLANCCMLPHKAGATDLLAKRATHHEKNTAFSSCAQIGWGSRVFQYSKGLFIRLFILYYFANYSIIDFV